MSAWDERDKEILRRYAIGETMPQLAAHFGVSTRRVSQRLALMGICARYQSNGPQPGEVIVTREQAREIVRLRLADESIASIAKAVGLKYHLVRSVLLAADIDTSNLRNINRPGVPRTCTKCGRTEAAGARFLPHAPWNQCAECLAAYHREFRQKRRQQARGDGGSAPLRGRAKVTPEQVDAILRRRAANEAVYRIAADLGVNWSVVGKILRANGIDTGHRNRVNGPGVPRTCTACLRTEEEGARFTPGEQANRCADCLATYQREYQRKKRATTAAEKRPGERPRPAGSGSPAGNRR